MTRLVPLALLLLLLAVTACGASSKTTRPAPTEPAESPEATAPTPERQPLAFDGRWVSLGTEFEIIGYEGVGIRGADLVVAVRRTKWTELELEGRSFREGSAELDLLTPTGTEVVEVDLDRPHPLDGHVIEVTFVGDTFDDSGRTVPHAKLIVKRK